MEHVAIMKKSWGLLPKILDRRKKIESRWYKYKHCPWGKIFAGDVVYFKNSGEPIYAMADIEKVISFSELTPVKVRQILEKYGKMDGIEKKKIQQFFKLFRDKKYCLLIFLKNPREIMPFEINKKGFGMMSAWVTLEDINKIMI